MIKTSDIAQRRALARANNDADYLQRRAELRDAAAGIFRTKGFSATKLQDVAAAVGLDRATIYYYVSGKDELFQDVVAGAVRDNLKMVEDLRAESRPAHEKISRLVVGLLNAYEEHYPYLYVYVQEDMVHLKGDAAWGQEMQSLGRRFDRAVREIVQQGLDEKTIAAAGGDARLIANAIIGMCNWTHRWFHPKSKGDAATVSKVFSEILLSGLTPRPEGPSSSR
jgi:TetR/AcrR family transcriptional regulator, cholesterol catabolism regulator